MKISVFILYFFLGLQVNYSQVTEETELFLKLQEMDSLLFEVGYNNCKISAFKDHISKDLEFYHDQGGLTSSKTEFLKTVKTNICSTPDKKPIRKLKTGSLEVFPLYNNDQLYGAIQRGEHDFYIQEPGKDLYFTSTAKFTHVWILQKNKWMLLRVLSYDHKNASL